MKNLGNTEINWPDFCTKIRKVYGLSYTAMSLLCGFGVNTWRNYENGEHPTASNQSIIKLLSNPVTMLNYVQHTIPERERREIFGPVSYRIFIEMLQLKNTEIREVQEKAIEAYLEKLYQK